MNANTKLWRDTEDAYFADPTTRVPCSHTRRDKMIVAGTRAHRPALQCRDCGHLEYTDSDPRIAFAVARLYSLPPEVIAAADVVGAIRAGMRGFV